MLFFFFAYIILTSIFLYFSRVFYQDNKDILSSKAYEAKSGDGYYVTYYGPTREEAQRNVRLYSWLFLTAPLWPLWLVVLPVWALVEYGPRMVAYLRQMIDDARGIKENENEHDPEHPLPDYRRLSLEGRESRCPYSD